MTRERNNETEKGCMARGRDLGIKAFVTYLGSLI